MNLLNRKVSDVDYFHDSQLRGAAAAASDIYIPRGAEDDTTRTGVEFSTTRGVAGAAADLT